MEDNKFLTYYKSEKEKLNKYIEKFNNELVIEDNPFIKENLDLFANLNKDGKLIRGTLVNFGYRLMKGESDYSYPLALAFEIFQTAILVHDDIIDHDDLRRGKTTIHAYNSQKYRDLTGSDRSDSLGDSLALCMGDLGLYEANRTISKNYSDDKLLGPVLNYFDDIAIKTVRGEMLDIILPFKEEYELEHENLEKDIMEVYKYKTSYYTIIGPLSLGMILGGADDERLKDIEKIGYNIGVAFQMQDDLLGIYGENIGKKVGSDIEEFKTTVLYAYTKKHKEYYDELLAHYGLKASDKSVEKVRAIFEKSGAKEYTENNVKELYEKAREMLSNVAWMNEEDKIILDGFIQYLESRSI